MALFRGNKEQERHKSLVLLMNRVETELDHLLFDSAHIRRMNGNPLTKVMGVSVEDAVRSGECTVAWIPYTTSSSSQAMGRENWLAAAQFWHDGQRWRAKIEHANGSFTDSE